MNTQAASPAYGLGHSQQELGRLRAQARLIDPITRHYFLEAGLKPGMRVLDVGSGAGDVALLAAELVGVKGEVVGVDRSADALDVARARASGCRNISFSQGDPMEMAFEREFDAVVGRYVVQFQQDPAALLKRLAGCLRPGGLMVFHETDWFAARSIPAAPLHDACCAWIVRTMELQGAQMHMGTGLRQAFLAAGLPEPSLRLQASIGGGKNAQDRLHMLVTLTRTLAEPMVRLGVASAADVDPDTLMERLLADTRDSVLVGYADVGAWAEV